MPFRPGKGSLAALVGSAAAAALFTLTPRFEGRVLVAAPDPVGIVTGCMGDTHDVKLGQKFTPEECEQRLEAQLVEHANGVDRCTPLATMTWYQRVAFIDFAYNVGASAYCKSTIAGYAKVGDMKNACRAINETPGGKPQWVYAGTERICENDKCKDVPRVLPGLVKRRATERAMCEGRMQ